MRLRTAVVFVVVVAAISAHTDAYFANLSGDKVRLRGGPADFHAVLTQLSRGTPVRVIGAEGDWQQVEVPGGFSAFVSLGRPGRTYMDVSKPGEGVVAVDDLMIRGSASADFPPIGRLGTGDRVVVLATDNGWARVLSPSAARSWIHGKYVARSEDQAATGEAFAARHAEARQALLAEGAASRELLARQEREAQLRKSVDAAFAKFETELAKPWDKRDVNGVRGALQGAIKELPEHDGDRVRAQAMLKHLDDWDKNRRDLVKAQERLAAAKEEAARAERTYAQDLRDLSRELTEEANKPRVPKSPYRARGHVQRASPVEAFRSGPKWSVSVGGRPSFYLTSDRYDWSEYEGKLIGILQAGEPENRSGLDARVIKVSRIEILDG